MRARLEAVRRDEVNMIYVSKVHRDFERIIEM